MTDKEEGPLVDEDLLVDVMRERGTMYHDERSYVTWQWTHVNSPLRPNSLP